MSKHGKSKGIDFTLLMALGAVAIYLLVWLCDKITGDKGGME